MEIAILIFIIIGAIVTCIYLCALLVSSNRVRIELSDNDDELLPV